MREVTTTRAGLILPPPVAQTLTGWLDQIAESEQDYYASNGPRRVDDPQPLDAAHGAASIAQAWLATTGEQPTPQPAHADRQAVPSAGPTHRPPGANPAAPTGRRPAPSRNPFAPTPSS
jgi:hypothetical protein